MWCGDCVNLTQCRLLVPGVIHFSAELRLWKMGYHKRTECLIRAHWIHDDCEEIGD